MERKIVKTVVTYNIQDDDIFEGAIRKALRDLLTEMGYEDGNNQSTMVHRRRIPQPTLKNINDLCQAVNFNEGDEISIYVTGRNQDDECVMIKHRFIYNSRSNRFQ